MIHDIDGGYGDLDTRILHRVKVARQMAAYGDARLIRVIIWERKAMSDAAEPVPASGLLASCYNAA